MRDRSDNTDLRILSSGSSRHLMGDESLLKDAEDCQIMCLLPTATRYASPSLES